MDRKNLANDIWQVAELLRGGFKQSGYGLVILPFTVLRRLECRTSCQRTLLAAFRKGV